MTKEDLKQEFEEFLIKEDGFSQFISSVLNYHKTSFNDYINLEDPYN